jgi:hypothetical protein
MDSGFSGVSALQRAWSTHTYPEFPTPPSFSHVAKMNTLRLATTLA